MDGLLPVRVALIHSRYSGRVPSGENVVVDSEMAALRSAGVEVGLFETDPAVVRAGGLYPARAAIRVASGHGRSFRREVADFSPDIVHVHNVFPDLGERSVAELPHRLVFTVHNYRLSCAAGTHFRAGQVCDLCVTDSVLNGVRYGCHHGLAGTLPLAVAHRHGPSKNPLVEAAAEVWSPSQFHLDHLVASGLPAHKSRVRPHFVAERDLTGRSEQRADHALFVGRLEPEKGVMELMTAWPSDGPALHLIGDGSLRTEAEGRARGTNVRVLGPRTRREVLELMGRARLLIFSSMWWEPFGLVAIEAMATGLPVVAIGDHASSEIVRGSDSGVVIPSLGGLSDAVGRILERPAAEWAAQLRGRFSEDFSEAAWLGRRLDDYHRLAD